MLLKYGHILDLYCVRLSYAAHFCENYTKLYCIAKHLKRDEIGGGGGENFRCHFLKKVPFLANIERYLKFLEYALTRGIFRYSYP